MATNTGNATSGKGGVMDRPTESNIPQGWQAGAGIYPFVLYHAGGHDFAAIPANITHYAQFLRDVYPEIMKLAQGQGLGTEMEHDHLPKALDLFVFATAQDLAAVPSQSIATAPDVCPCLIIGVAYGGDSDALRSNTWRVWNLDATNYGGVIGGNVRGDTTAAAAPARQSQPKGSTKSTTRPTVGSTRGRS